MSSRHILLIGYRKPVVQAAQELGLEIIIWNDKAIPDKARKKIAAFYAAPFLKLHDVISKTLLQQLKQFSFHAVIATGEKTVITAAKVREQFSLPGLRPNTVITCHDKIKMKEVMQEANVPVTPFLCIDSFTQPDQLIETLGFPLIIKQRASSGSRGLVLANTLKEVTQHLKQDWLAEKFIHGVEMSVESFVHQNKIIWQNVTQYYQPKFINLVPGNLSAELWEMISQFNAKVIRALNIERGITHLEFFVTPQELVFGEIAIRPPGGYIMDLFELSYGFKSWQTFIQLELGESVVLPQTKPKTSAVWIIHPGPGRVKNVEGWREVLRLPTVCQAKLSLKVGDTLKNREGVGESYGQVFFTDSDRDNVVKSLEIAREKLRIEVRS